jgi:hypothetical protein
MPKIRIVNVSDEPVAVVVGDPAAEGPSSVHRLAHLEGVEVEVRGNPNDPVLGQAVMAALLPDGPWIDEVVAETVDDNDGSDV